ncbi:MAG: hypothetical protein ACT4QA_23875 [Panacagrimonas sp.]
MTADTIPLRFWLSERLDELLSDLQRSSNTSRSECVRAVFAHYLYGTHGRPQAHAGPAKSVCRRGSWGGRAPELGKNCVDAKLWLAPTMRNDLARRAERAGLTLSHFAREVLITHLLGHNYLPQRPALFVTHSAPGDAAQQE